MSDSGLLIFFRFPCANPQHSLEGARIHAGPEFARSLFFHRRPTHRRRRNRTHAPHALGDHSRGEHACTLPGPHFASGPARRGTAPDCSGAAPSRSENRSCGSSGRLRISARSLRLVRHFSPSLGCSILTTTKTPRLAHSSAPPCTGLRLSRVLAHSQTPPKAPMPEFFLPPANP